jgi:hypothetical protein
MGEGEYVANMKTIIRIPDIVSSLPHFRSLKWGRAGRGSNAGVAQEMTVI